MSMEQVSNYAAANGVLIMPIVDECAYRNTHDESTAFGSEYEETTAAQTLPNQPVSRAVVRGRGRRRSVPGEVTIVCQEIVKVCTTPPSCGVS